MISASLLTFCVLALYGGAAEQPPSLGVTNRCNSLRGKVPPELVAQKKHWIGTTEEVTLEKLKGRVVWLEFNYCEGCTPLRHELMKWHKRYAKQGLVIIEITCGRFDTLDAVRKSVHKQGVEHFVLWDKDNQNHKAFGVRAWPVAYLVGADRKVVWEGNPNWALDPPRPGCPRAVDCIERELKKLSKNSSLAETASGDRTDGEP